MEILQRKGGEHKDGLRTKQEHSAPYRRAAVAAGADRESSGHEGSSNSRFSPSPSRPPPVASSMTAMSGPRSSKRAEPRHVPAARWRGRELPSSNRLFRGD